MTVIIDGCGTNTYSIICALEKLGVTAVITSDLEQIASADRVILPGVGHANYMMKRLESRSIIPVIQKLTQPVLGICLGMQLLYAQSDEGDVQGLSIFPNRIQRLPDLEQPLPHMGWNTLKISEDHPLLYGIQSGDYVYFVHSYFAKVGDETLASSNYGTDFSAVVAKDNVMGTQFHPERSGKIGFQILKNFITMRSA